MFIHLTTHSAYSLQEGLLLPSELVQAAQAEGMPALGLTDHRLLSGTVEFVQACQKTGIQPIVGLEVDLATGPLNLLATSREGWVNLCRLSSALALREQPETPCAWDMLANCTGDLLALCPANTSQASLQQLTELFPGRFYLTLQNPAHILPVSKLSQKLHLSAVVTHPVYYLTPNQAGLQRTLTAIRLNQRLAELQPAATAPEDAWFVSGREMQARYRYFPAGLEATLEIAQRCKFDFPLGKTYMPIVPLPPDMTAAQTLRAKAEDGARRLYGRLTPSIQARLDQELQVITEMGYEPIFLIVEEILAFARQNGVPFSSRGSAASSLVAHCLDITGPDPLRLNLYFERFLNPARATPPDIDTDLCSRRREGVIQHVFDTYGVDRVAMVGTINRYRPRSAVGDVAKAHGLEQIQISRMIKQLPYAYFAAQQEGDESAPPPSPFADLRKKCQSPVEQQILTEAEALLKLPRHLSVHAGGLIVAPCLLTDLAPVMLSGSKGIIITQMDVKAVEALGLVKIDLLGIRGLSVLGDVAAQLYASHSKSYANILWVLEAIPSEDPSTSQMVEHGQTIGCFQIESPGMRATLREICARTEDDLMAALALYRPGPLKGGLKDAFVRRFKGQETVQHLHPALAPLLDETFGVILYQEQVLRIAHELAGFSLAEADLLRRAMGHFDPGRRMQELQRKFIEQAQQRSDLPWETGERVWDLMAAFAGYGFPKAHAASYARVAWRSAWCKTHFPAVFMAAVLANWGGYYSQRVYISEARRMGLTVRAPDVNASQNHFSVQKDKETGEALFMGLEQVKNLTRRTIQRILRGQPFSSLDDFLVRVDPRPQEAESLVCIGALEEWGNIPALLRRLQTGKRQPGQMSLFLPHTPPIEDWTLVDKMNAQQNLLGISLVAHPLELLADQITAGGAIPLLEAAERIGQRVTVAGMRQSGRRSRTARGDLMMFLSLEDQTGTLDVILFPEPYRRAREVLSSGGPFLVTGKIELESLRQDPYLRAEKVERLG